MKASRLRPTEDKLSAAYRHVLGNLQTNITCKKDLKAGAISYEEFRRITYKIPDVGFEDFLQALEQITDSRDGSKICLSTFVSRITKLASILATYYAKAKTSCLQPPPFQSTGTVQVLSEKPKEERHALKKTQGLSQRPACQFQSFVMRVMETKEFDICLTSCQIVPQHLETKSHFARYWNRGPETMTRATHAVVTSGLHSSLVNVAGVDKRSLEVVFTMCDWDGNGSLCTDELAFYLYQTGGGNLDEEEWSSWRKARGGSNKEITLEDFFQFHLEQINNKEGDLQVLWPILRAFGFNSRLQLQHAIPYNLTISARMSESKVVVTVEHIYREIVDCDDVEHYLARWATSRTGPTRDLFQVHLSGAINAHLGPGLLVKTNPVCKPQESIADTLEYTVECACTRSQVGRLKSLVQVAKSVWTFLSP
ncbi:unnamed protein product [Schistocephalus solidus]|uniref:EF-hand domain-containing protein n=1 Tax=Schistocephalus solidus TaxID=70667 RepID=A0A183T767_SCHSO|nr:unnamed protein product [Schistocephalus solidus]